MIILFIYYIIKIQIVSITFFKSNFLVMALNSLKQFRKEIDKIDHKIIELLNQRISWVKKVGLLKEKSASLTVYDPEREKQIYQKLIDYSQKLKSDLSPSIIKSVFNEIIAYSRSLEEALTVGYLGPKGSYTYSATLEKFGFATKLDSFHSISDVFWAVQNDKIKFGVVPFENSIEGIVNNTLDLLAKNDLKIYAHFYKSIKLNLLSQEKKIEKIKTLYSHPQPFAQARGWLEKKFKNVLLKETASTSAAALIASKTKKSACIGSLDLVKLYPKLQVFEESIQDISNNMTRFLIISKENHPYPSSKKSFTSLVVFIKDKKGALYEILSILAENKINLNNIISRPSLKKNFDYYFFIEFIGNQKKSNVETALNKISKKVLQLKVLGSY